MAETTFELDRYVEYYTEKLWAMIPEVYRHEDGIAVQPGVLRAIVATWARQAANLRRSQDRAWEDLFIELCSTWVIPYIGDLVATRMISALNPRGQRVDVAKTIFYRRRAGTLMVLEGLIADVTGWEGVVVEGWKTLARTFHNLDSPPVPRGPYSLTPAGGTVELRQADTSRLVGSPFEEFARSPDMRRHQPYTISKIAFHLYRLSVYKLNNIDPRPFPAPDGQGYTFDPSGRDVPLFAKRTRPERWDTWTSALEYELPDAIPCRLLGDAHYKLRAEDADEMIAEVGLTNAAADDLRALGGLRFDSEGRLRQRLMMQPTQAELLTEPVYQAILRRGALPDCGKYHLLEPSLDPSILIEADGDALPTEKIAAANLSVWEASPLNKQALIDPERGRLLVYDPQPGEISVDYHVGIYMPVGAGGFVREISLVPDANFNGGGALNLPGDGVAIIDDSRTYTPVADAAVTGELTASAADQERPYLRLDADWVLTAAPAAGDPDPILTLDGLWIGAEGGERALVLEGDYEWVSLRYCTLDPGGEDANGDPIPPVPLIIRGYVETLILDHCITGVIRLDGGTVESCVIRDSIVQSRDQGTAAITIGTGVVNMTRTTVIGMVDVLRLFATDSLIAGLVDVTDTQEGCFRFSAAAPGSRLPRPYESITLDKGLTRGLFVSQEYGQPGYAMLREPASPLIGRGAESGSEMGVFNAVGAPFKRDGIRAKVAEFMPFGLIPVFIDQT